MDKHLNVTKEELESLSKVISQISSRAKYNITLNKLINGWADFVHSVERGYDDSIYEYTNDLSTRSLLLEVINSVDDSLKSKILKILKPLDDKFIATTVATDRPLMRENEEGHFWLFRIPKKLTTELKEDLRAEGFLR